MATVTGSADLKRRVRNYQARARRTFVATLEGEAQIVAQRMRQEHLWTNRTGNAERGLQCLALSHNNGQRVVLQASYGPNVPYDIFLELGHMGKYAILFRTLRSQWPTTLRRVAAALSAVKPV